MRTVLPRLAVCACVSALPVVAWFTAPIRDTVVAVILLAALVAHAVGRRSMAICPNVLTAAVLTALGVALVQCLPLPRTLLGLLSPGAVEVYAVTRPDAGFLPA